MNSHRQRQWFLGDEKFSFVRRCHSRFHRLACGLRMSMHAVSLQKAPVPEETFSDEGEAPSPVPEPQPKPQWEQWLRVQPDSAAARWANRVVLLGVALFTLSLPHSIAAAHVSLVLSALAWITRDVLMRRFHFQRTPLDVPLVAFAALTLLSTIFSAEPTLSFPKLKSLLLFGVASSSVRRILENSR